MRKLRFVHIMLGVVLLTACEKKELPEDTFEDPEFFAEGTIDGDPFSLIAGPDDITVESDAHLEEDEIPQFEIVFQNSNCADCNELLEIVILGESEYTSESAFEDVISEEIFEVSPYYPEDAFIENLYTLNLDEDFDVTIFDETNGFEIDIDNSIVFLEEGDYVMAYSSLFLDGCEMNYTGGFSVDDDGDICIQQIDIYEDQGILFIDFSDFDEGFSVSSDAAFLNIAPGNTVFPLADFLVFENLTIFIEPINDESCFNQPIIYSFVSNGITEECFEPIELDPIDIFQELSPQSVLIRYEDANGVEYVSGGDMFNDYFNITDIQSFGEDPQGRETYKIQVEFLATLVNTDNETDFITLEVTEAFIPLVFE